MPKSASANFTLYPLLWLSVCFVSGILSASFLSLNWRIYLVICLAFAVSAAFFIKQKFALLFISAAFVAVGGLHFQIENQSIAENRVKRLYDENRVKSSDPIEIEGVLRGKPELAVGGFFLVLVTERAIYKESEIEISGNVRLFAAAPDEKIKNEYERLDLNHGSRIRVACRLRRQDDYLNAGVLSQTRFLDQKQIDASAIIKSPLLVEKIAETKTAPPLAW